MMDDMPNLLTLWGSCYVHFLLNQAKGRRAPGFLKSLLCGCVCVCVLCVCVCCVCVCVCVWMCVSAPRAIKNYSHEMKSE